MIESMNNIKYWFSLYYADGAFLIMAMIACLYLFVRCKDIRVKLLCPVIMIVFCVVNPILHKFVYSGIIYWRLFWMIPDAIIIALAITIFIRNCNKNWGKMLLLAIMIILIVVNGTNAFLYGGFVKTENWEKLPQPTLAVCDMILEVDDDPKGIFPRGLYSNVRQYAPQIEMMYGRNAENFIGWCGMECMLTYWRMEKDVPDYDFIFRQADIASCDFVVIEEAKAAAAEIPGQYQYAEIGRTQGYVIYYNEQIDMEQNKN